VKIFEPHSDAKTFARNFKNLFKFQRIKLREPSECGTLKNDFKLKSTFPISAESASSARKISVKGKF
jgi:hypothetical protein